MGYRRWWLAAALLLFTSLLGIQAGRFSALYRPPIKLVAAGITFSLHDEEQFNQTLADIEKRILGEPVQLVADEQMWNVKGLDLGVRLDRGSMWKEANQSIVGRHTWAYFRRSAPRMLQVRLTYDSEKLDQFLATLAARFWQPPRNAHIDSGGRMLPDQLGRSLDVPATRQKLLTSWIRGERIVVAHINRLEPVTTVGTLQNIGAKYVLARYSSYFDPQKEGRVDNIKMAAQLLDGVVIPPQQEFSFNTTVGPRTLDRGFQVAEEIVNQELVPGVGGGVCQVSSTLYNAALLSGAHITQRQNHSRPLGYIAMGRDATVYYGAIDFRFRNPYVFSLVLSTEVVENRLSVSVLAPQKLDMEYGIVVTDVQQLPAGERVTPDASMEPGQMFQVKAGQPGWEVRTWRLARTLDGTELLREQISHDRYPPQPAMVRANPETWGVALPQPASASVPEPEGHRPPDTKPSPLLRILDSIL